MKQYQYNFDWQDNTGYTELSPENKGKNKLLNASMGNAPTAINMKSNNEIQQLN